MELIKAGGMLSREISLQIADFEKAVKEIEAREKELKRLILEEMELKGIVKIETEELIINYIAPTDRESFDSKGFRKDNPTLYDKYVSMTPVKSSIRIKVKGEKK